MPPLTVGCSYWLEEVVQLHHESYTPSQFEPELYYCLSCLAGRVTVYEIMDYGLCNKYVLVVDVQFTKVCRFITKWCVCQ